MQKAPPPSLGGLCDPALRPWLIELRDSGAASSESTSTLADEHDSSQTFTHCGQIELFLPGHTVFIKYQSDKIIFISCILFTSVIYNSHNKREPMICAF